MESPNVFNALLDIQAKHVAYFYKHKKTIADCITIYWKDPVSVRIKDMDLPVDIKNDIESAFLIKS